MNNIVKFQNFKRGTKDYIKTLLKKLENLEQHHYSYLEIENVANKILTLFDYYTKNSSTPVIKHCLQWSIKL